MLLGLRRVPGLQRPGTPLAPSMGGDTRSLFVRLPVMALHGLNLVNDPLLGSVYRLSISIHDHGAVSVDSQDPHGVLLLTCREVYQ